MTKVKMIVCGCFIISIVALIAKADLGVDEDYWLVAGRNYRFPIMAGDDDPGETLLFTKIDGPEWWTLEEFNETWSVDPCTPPLSCVECSAIARIPSEISGHFDLSIKVTDRKDSVYKTISIYVHDMSINHVPTLEIGEPEEFTEDVPPDADLE